MNWFIYIAGWVWGLGFVNANVIDPIGRMSRDQFMIVKLILWTMTWIWICWRFIR